MEALHLIKKASDITATLIETAHKSDTMAATTAMYEHFNDPKPIIVPVDYSIGYSPRNVMSVKHMLTFLQANQNKPIIFEITDHSLKREEIFNTLLAFCDTGTAELYSPECIMSHTLSHPPVIVYLGAGREYAVKQKLKRLKQHCAYISI